MKYSEFFGIRRDAFSSVIDEGITMLTDCAQGAGILDDYSIHIDQFYGIGTVGIIC